MKNKESLRATLALPRNIPSIRRSKEINQQSTLIRAYSSQHETSAFRRDEYTRQNGELVKRQVPSEWKGEMQPNGFQLGHPLAATTDTASCNTSSEHFDRNSTSHHLVASPRRIATANRCAPFITMTTERLYTRTLIYRADANSTLACERARALARRS